MMKELITAFAHEIKNPVQLALAHVALIRLADEQRLMAAHCEHIERALYEINALAIRFLALVNIAPQHVGPENALQSERAVEIGGLINEILSEYRAAKPEMKFKLQPAPPVKLHCDEALLRMVFTNLIKNAAEASEPNGQVDVSVESADETIKIFIHDNGTGLYLNEAPDKPQSYTTKLSGNGLGLAICRYILSLYDGLVTLSNNEQHGCVAAVTLRNHQSDRL